MVMGHLSFVSVRCTFSDCLARGSLVESQRTFARPRANPSPVWEADASFQAGPLDGQNSLCLAYKRTAAQPACLVVVRVGGPAVTVETSGSHREAAEISALPGSLAFLFKVLKNTFD